MSKSYGICTYRALIVEDDPLTLALMSKMMCSVADFEIASCLSAKEAIGKLNYWKPDIVVSDFMMDDGDGIDLLHTVRKTLGEKVLFVFVTSAHTDFLRPLLAGEVNLNIIKKPLRLNKTEDMIKNWLQFQQAQPVLQ